MGIAVAYATGEDLAKRFDIDVVGQLASDDREDIDRNTIPTHPNVLTALDDASGDIDVQLLAGGRYTPSQLAGLTGHSRNHLTRIVCTVAMSYLFGRRTEPIFEDLAERVSKQSRESLKALSEGKNVFGIPEIEKASTIGLESIEAIEIETLNLLPGRMAPYFPRSAQRMPR